MNLDWLGLIAEWSYWTGKLKNAKQWGAAITFANEQRNRVRNAIERYSRSNSSS